MLTKILTVPAGKATSEDLLSLGYEQDVPLFDQSPYVLSIRTQEPMYGTGKNFVAVLRQDLVDAWAQVDATEITARVDYRFATPQGFLQQGGGAAANGPFIRQPENETNCGSTTDTYLTGPNNAVWELDVTVPDDFASAPVMGAPKFVTFDTPASFVQDEVLTMRNAVGITEVKVVENNPNGLVAELTFDEPYAAFDGYIADSQLVGGNGGVWDAGDYDQYNKRMGLIKSKATGACQVWLPKSDDLAVARTISVIVHGVS